MAGAFAVYAPVVRCRRSGSPKVDACERKHDNCSTVLTGSTPMRGDEPWPG